MQSIRDSRGNWASTEVGATDSARRLSVSLALAASCCRRSLSFAIGPARLDVCMAPAYVLDLGDREIGQIAKSSHEVPALHSDRQESQKTRRAPLAVSLCETDVRRDA